MQVGRAAISVCIMSKSNNNLKAFKLEKYLARVLHRFPIGYYLTMVVILCVIASCALILIVTPAIPPISTLEMIVCIFLLLCIFSILIFLWDRERYRSGVFRFNQIGRRKVEISVHPTRSLRYELRNTWEPLNEVVDPQTRRVCIYMKTVMFKSATLERFGFKIRKIHWLRMLCYSLIFLIQQIWWRLIIPISILIDSFSILASQGNNAWRAYIKTELRQRLPRFKIWPWIEGEIEFGELVDNLTRLNSTSTSRRSKTHTT